MQYKSYIHSIAALSLTLGSGVLQAKENWVLSLGTGLALNQSSDIVLDMDDGSEINLNSVNWHSKPFTSPLYYNVRLSKWADEHAYEFEFIHHKLYAESSALNNRVSRLEITDGYNLLYGNYAYLFKENWVARAGLGITLPHPDVTVDGNRSHGPYQVAGVTVQFALEREFPVSDTYLFGIESKVTYAYSDMDLDDGSMTISNTALHIIASVKYQI